MRSSKKVLFLVDIILGGGGDYVFEKKKKGIKKYLDGKAKEKYLKVPCRVHWLERQIC